MRTRSSGLAAALLLLLVSACGGESGGESGAPAGQGGSEQPLRVGLSVSLSGPVADTGQKMLDGAELWVAEGNTILGRPVELVVQDDESLPATAARLYERLITVDQVDLLVGPYGSGPSAAVATITDRHDRFILMSGASALTIFRDSEMAVQLMSPQLHLPQLAIKPASEQGYQTIAAAAIDNPYGRECLEGVKMYAEEFGLEVVYEEVYPVEPKDLSSMILNMQQASPDVTYVCAYAPDSILFMQQAQQLRFNSKMYVLGATGPVTPEFVTALGDAAEYALGTAQWHPQAAYPGIDEFVASFEDEYGSAPDYVHATGYAAMEVLSRIAEDAGSLDDDAMLEAALAADYQTLYGGFNVDDTGIQVAERGALTQIQDGEIVPVYPPGTDWELQLPTPAWNER